MKTSKPKVKADGPGRPTARRVASINSAIQTAALDLFVEPGFDATTMEAIAQRAKVSKGTLYARFGSKEAVLHTVLTDLVTRWSARGEAEDHLVEDQLDAWIFRYARTIAESMFWPEVRQADRIVTAIMASKPDVARDYLEHGTARFIATMGLQLSRLAAIPADRAEAVGAVLIHAITGWFKFESTRRKVTETDLTGFAERTAQLLLAARSDW